MARGGERRVALAVAAAAFWRELGFEEALMRRLGYHTGNRRGADDGQCFNLWFHHPARRKR
jgi:hypothetical protein